MMLPLLAIVFAVVSAIASVDVVSLDAPIRYLDTTPCDTCEALDDPADCSTVQQENSVRCECIADTPEGPMVFNADNVACQSLWKDPTH